MPKFAPHWEKVGTRLKFTQKVKELKHPSCRLSEVVKMTAIFDEWSRVHGRNVSWLNLVDALEEDEDLAWLKGYVGQHLQAKVGSVRHYSETSDSGLSRIRTQYNNLFTIDMTYGPSKILQTFQASQLTTSPQRTDQLNLWLPQSVLYLEVYCI